VRPNDSTVSGNTADFFGGGGIDNIAATVTLNNSAVSDNTSTATIFVLGGGIENTNGTVTLNDSTVTNNVPINCDPPGSVAGCIG
jgi:hypothetical protein